MWTPLVGRILRGSALGVALAGALSMGATAQGGHPSAPAPRPLQHRVAAADAAVVARVVGIRPGRIELETERALLGDLTERFEVKRAGSRPPPLEPDDRALLFLRGARSPYVLVDEAHETIRLVDPVSAKRWSQAVERLVATQDDPEAQLALYARWIDEGPDTLRELGVRGISDPRAAFAPLSDRVLRERARAALDETRSPEARRASALLVLRSPGETGWLLSHLPAQPDGTGATVALLALQGGVLHERDELLPALATSLQVRSTRLRDGALQVLETSRLPIDGPLRSALVELTRSETRPEARARAQALLKRGS